MYGCTMLYVVVIVLYPVVMVSLCVVGKHGVGNLYMVLHIIVMMMHSNVQCCMVLFDDVHCCALLYGVKCAL